MSTSNGIGAIAYHFLKEFGSSGGLAHAHGLVWQEDSRGKQALLKMQKGMSLSISEMEDVCNLADNTVTASLNTFHLANHFPDLNDTRSNDVVQLAKSVQSHRCGDE